MDKNELRPRTELAEEITDRLFEAYDGTLRGDRLAIMQKTEDPAIECDLGGRSRDSVLTLIRSILLRRTAELPRPSAEPVQLALRAEIALQSAMKLYEMDVVREIQSYPRYYSGEGQLHTACDLIEWKEEGMRMADAILAAVKGEVTA